MANNKDYKTVEIERLFLGEYRRLTDDWQSLSQSAEVFIKQMAGEMALGIKAFVNKTERTISVRKTYRPKSTWDMVKLNWLPLWTRRFTVIEFETIITETKHTFLCPHVYFGGRDSTVHIAYLSQGNLKLDPESNNESL